MPPSRGVSGISYWDEAPGHTQDMLERLYLSVDQCSVPLAKLEEVVRVREVWASLQRLLLLRAEPECRAAIIMTTIFIHFYLLHNNNNNNKEIIFLY